MKLRKVLMLGILLLSAVTMNAQHRKNLNKWFIGGTVGTTFTHMDIRPSGFDPYLKAPFDYFSYTLAPEVSYHFTHGLGVVAQYNYSKVKGNEEGKQGGGWDLREFNTNLSEIKLMAHINFGQALSFNKRRNMVNPYINVGVGPTWGRINSPINPDVNLEYAPHLLYQDGHIEALDDINDPIKFDTWNKNIQFGFYFYGNRYFDFDVRYNYTFYNEDYIDGSAIESFINREWDKYSSISVGGKFKFGVNNRQTYEHTSWARPLIEEDTSLFNNLVLMEEYDDGLGNTVFKMRPGDQINEEELTKIETNSDDDEMYQAIYNTLMNNPDLRDSLLKSLAKDLTQNDAFIVNITDNVCDNCKPQYVSETRTIIRETEGEEGEEGYDSTTGERRRRSGTGEEKKVRPPIGYTGPTEFQLEDIYYDLDKYFIRDDAAKTLDELSQILKKYPSLKIELGSHTDCRNSKKYNLWLSQKRADAAISYLVCKGIDACRLVATGYGESKLVNDCECEGNEVSRDCSDDEHQANRRTTVSILDYNYTPSSNCKGVSIVDAQAVLDAAKNSRSKSVEEYSVTPKAIEDAGISKGGATAGYYVVVGTSVRPDYARAFANEVKGGGYDGSGIFYRNDKSYFVYLKRYDDYAEAIKEVKNMRCCGKYPDAWIHVHNK